MQYEHHTTSDNSSNKLDPLAFVILFLVLLLWILGCLIIGVIQSTSPRFDLLLWGFLAVVPAILFFVFLVIRWDFYTISSWRIIMVIGVSSVVYIFILILEYLVIYSLLSIVNISTIESNPFTWWQSLLLSLLFSFSVPATIEEFGKFFICSTTFNKRNNSPTKKLDIIIISMIGALSLSTIENCQYVLRMFETEATPFILFVEVLMRDLFSVTLHISTGTIIGAGIASAVENKKNIICQIPKILILPIILHGLYDGTLLWVSINVKSTGNVWLSGIYLLAIFIVIISISLAIIKYKQAKSKNTQDEVNFELEEL